MVVDPQDLNSVSSGSFFTNPILSPQEFARVQATWKDSGNDLAEIPAYREAGSIKIPAAWLVEQSGFEKGYTERNVGISEHHALALVNRGGTTSDLLALAAKIEQAVFEQFGIRLAREPNIIE